jgi:DNA-directed RNA polymerase subunit M/transcription elongation factor TFIIS
MAIHFCSECSNLMCPKVDNGDLFYTCAKCETTVEPDSSVLSTINFRTRHDSSVCRTSDLIHDVSLPRINIKCERCGHGECIGYMEKNEEKALNFYYVCTKCLFEWTD